MVWSRRTNTDGGSGAVGTRWCLLGSMGQVYIESWTESPRSLRIVQCLVTRLDVVGGYCAGFESKERGTRYRFCGRSPGGWVGDQRGCYEGAHAACLPGDVTDIHQDSPGTIPNYFKINPTGPQLPYIDAIILLENSQMITFRLMANWTLPRSR